MEAAKNIPSVSLLPGMLPPEELFWHWRRAITPYFDSVPLSDPRQPPQVPTVHMYNSGGFLFLDTKLSGQKFVRDSSWKRRNDDSDHIAIQLFLNGRNYCENGGTDFVLDGNGIYAVNLGYEIDAFCSDAEVLTVVLPRDRVADDLPSLTEARGMLFENSSASGRLLTGYLRTMRDIMPTTAETEAPLLTESLVGLLRALLTAGDALSVEAQSGVRTALQRYIEGQLGSPDLGVDSICAHFRMSRATLYRLFKPEGGVRNYIQRRRLMAVFKALTAPANLDRGAFAIGLDYCILSPSYLSTSFREHFGMSPSAVREAARSRLKSGNLSSADFSDRGLCDFEIMERWGRELRNSHPKDPLHRLHGTPDRGPGMTVGAGR